MSQRFKENDAPEPTVYNLILSSLEALGADRNAFFTGAFEAFGLGSVLYDLARDPLTDVITRDVYRTSFPSIHELFTRPGTFEFYLSVFRKIFTDDTDIQFKIPGPGQLSIIVTAITAEKFNILTRSIVADVYVYGTLVTSDTNDPIMGLGVKGIKTQSEIDGLLAEISAYGVFTTVELVLP